MVQCAHVHTSGSEREYVSGCECATLQAWGAGATVCALVSVRACGSERVYEWLCAPLQACV